MALLFTDSFFSLFVMRRLLARQLNPPPLSLTCIRPRRLDGRRHPPLTSNITSSSRDEGLWLSAKASTGLATCRAAEVPVRSTRIHNVTPFLKPCSVLCYRLCARCFVVCPSGIQLEPSD
ncbi:hypothetical protein GGI42DRAFT_4529 [Trichoderma sp. SZMC 28013]